MAFTSANSSATPVSFSVGPVKMQIVTYSAASGDTSGTITADKLSTITNIFCAGSLTFSAAPTFSGNVATLAFTNPGATVFGTALVLGY